MQHLTESKPNRDSQDKARLPLHTPSPTVTQGRFCKVHSKGAWALGVSRNAWPQPLANTWTSSSTSLLTVLCSFSSFHYLVDMILSITRFKQKRDFMFSHKSWWLLGSALITEGLSPLTALVIKVMERKEFHPYRISDVTHFYVLSVWCSASNPPYVSHIYRILN